MEKFKKPVYIQVFHIKIKIKKILIYNDVEIKSIFNYGKFKMNLVREPPEREVFASTFAKHRQFPG